MNGGSGCTWGLNAGAVSVLHHSNRHTAIHKTPFHPHLNRPATAVNYWPTAGEQPSVDGALPSDQPPTAGCSPKRS